MMKMNKKLMIVLLMALGVSQGLSAQLSKSPSLFARACSYVPFKSTLGLGLGLMAASAYCAYQVNVLGLELGELNKQKPIPVPAPTKPESKIQAIASDIKQLKALDDQVESFIANKKKILDCGSQIAAIKKGFEALACTQHTSIALLSIKLIEKHIELVPRIINAMDEYSQKHQCDIRVCANLAPQRKDLMQSDNIAQQNLETLNNQCLEIEKALQKDKATEETRLKSLNKQYDESVASVNKQNNTAALKRIVLNDTINSRRDWIKYFGLSGITVAFLAGISKYFSR